MKHTSAAGTLDEIRMILGCGSLGKLLLTANLLPPSFQGNGYGPPPDKFGLQAILLYNIQLFSWIANNFTFD
jgi:hypothetical protein